MGAADVVLGSDTGRWPRIHIYVGLYSIVLGIATLCFEYFYGSFQRHPAKFPVRGVVYLGASIFCCFTNVGIMHGMFFMCTAIMQVLACMYFRESYYVPPEKSKAAELEFTFNQEDVSVLFCGGDVCYRSFRSRLTLCLSHTTVFR